MQISYSIIYVSDMAQSVSFYRDVLGLLVRFESPEWTELATPDEEGGATLALHKSKAPDARDTTGHVAGTCQPGFQVPDINAFHRRMLEHRVPCVREPKDVFGSMVAQYRDPDGLVFAVGEASNDS